MKHFEVYGVINENEELIVDQRSFYSKETVARGVANEMNKHVSNRASKYSVRKFYLV